MRGGGVVVVGSSWCLKNVSKFSRVSVGVRKDVNKISTAFSRSIENQIGGEKMSTKPETMEKCRVHRWNVEEWLPLYGHRPVTRTEIVCVQCGRILKVENTSPGQRSRIADGIARRLYDGDEHSEVQGRSAGCEGLRGLPEAAGEAAAREEAGEAETRRS